MLGDELGLGSGNQIGVLVAQSKEAGRFDADDGDAGGGKGPQRFDVAAGPLAGCVEHTFGDSRPTAANKAVDEADPVAERLQDRYGGMPDLRVEIVGEGVVEENDFATRCRRAGGTRSPTGEAARKGLAGEDRDGAGTMNARRLFEKKPQRRNPPSDVDERGEGRGDAGERADMREGAGAARQAVHIMVLGEDFILELGEINAGGTLALARLALNTEVEGFVDALTGEVLGWQDTVEGLAKEIGTTAGGVLFILSNHVGGAHAAVELAASALAVAELDGTGEAAIGGKAEIGRRIPIDGMGTEAEVIGEGWHVNDLAGIEETGRIEDSFEFTEGLDDSDAEHALHENAAQNAITVLATEAALKLHDEIDDTLGEALHGGKLGSIFDIRVGTDVETADARVAVVGGCEAMVAY